MRNLKKVLSLSLALVMLLGMMVVGAGAAAFDDVADGADKQEAIEVLNAIDILKGDGTGNFNPNGTLTRAEAAVIISKVHLTPALVEKLSAAETTFNDVADYQNGWAIPYVEACAIEQIILGDGQGNFNPGTEVGGADFAAMLLRVMGIDHGQFTNWPYDWQKAAIEAGLDANGVSVYTTKLSRQDAAQMAFNALIYSAKGESKEFVVKNGDEEIYRGTNETLAMAAVLGNEGSKLTEETVAADDSLAVTRFHLDTTTGTDDFGRTTTVWTVNDRLAVTLKGDEPMKVYTEAVTAAAVKADLGSKVTDAQAAEIAGATANGKLVEVYAGANGKYGSKIEVDYSVGELKTTTATNGNVTYSVGTLKGIDYANNTTDTVVLEGAVEKGDIVTAHMGAKALHIYPTDQVVGTMTSYTSKTNTVAVDGVPYTVGTGVTGYATITNDLLGEADYTYYLDQYGFVVGFEAPEGEAAPEVNYAYIQAAGDVTYTASSTLTGGNPSATAKVRAILADGSVDLYDLVITAKKDKDDSNAVHFFCGDVNLGKASDLNDVTKLTNKLTGADGITGKVLGYSLKDGKLTLKNADAKTIVNTLGGTGYTGGNTMTVGTTSSKSALVTANTVFVVIDKDGDKASDPDAWTFTGSLPVTSGQTLSNGATTYVVMKVASASASTGTAAVVFTTEHGKIDDTNNDAAGYAYVDGDSVVTTAGAKAGEFVYTYEAVDNNGSLKLTGPNASVVSGVYKYNKDDEIVGSAIAGKTVEVLGGNINYSGAWYTLTDDTVYVSLDDEITADDEGADGNVCVVIVESGKATWVFILEAGTINNVPVGGSETIEAGTDKVIANDVAGELEVAGSVTVEGGVTETGTVTAESGSDVTIEGGVSGTVNATNGSTVAIEGEVTGTVSATGNANVTIEGEVAEGAEINVASTATVTINGEVFNGKLTAKTVVTRDGSPAAGITIKADIGSKAEITVEAGSLTIDGTIKQGANVTLTAGITKFEAKDFEEAVKLVKSGATKWKSTGDASTKGVRGTLGDGVYVTDKANYVNGGNEGKTYDYLVVISGVTKTVDHYDETWELTYEGGTAEAHATWPESGSGGNFNPGQQTLVNHFYDKKDPIGSNTVQESWDPEAAVTESGYIHYTCVVTFTDNTTQTVEYSYSYAGATADET